MSREAEEIIKSYNLSDLGLAVLGSHSALQLLHGAKAERLKTILIVEEKRKKLYKRYSHLIDVWVAVSDFSKLGENEAEKIRTLNGVLIPHGSLVEYLGYEKLKSLRVPLFGLRELVKWERDWKLKLRLLRESGIPTPRIYEDPEEVDSPVIVKLPGAKGGRGYFFAEEGREVKEGLEKALASGLIKNPGEAIIQEYVIGVPLYFHYFYSPIYERVELMGMDIRYESNVDGLKRIPGRLRAEPSFTVTGNIPVVARERLLEEIYEYGEAFAETTKQLIPPGIIGPFSLEAVVTENLEVKVFEFSGRIVAGTNLYTHGSPYSWLFWNEPMSMGKRIARELRLASERGILKSIVT